jgi:hypothetical protein
LTHAALESYFEELGKGAAMKARELFKKNGVITHSLVSLIAAKTLSEISGKSKRKVSESLVSNLAMFSEESCNEYVRVLNQNNGIKTQNLKDILIPVGVDPEKIDLVTTNSLNAYGVSRGEIAHLFVAIRSEHTVSSVNSALSGVVKGIESFDQAVCNALAHSMKKP